MKTLSLHRVAFLAFAALVLTAVPASAHHIMGGEMPSTFGQGLLSGLGHPVIGPDHLAFLIAVGVATLTGVQLSTAGLLGQQADQTATPPETRTNKTPAITIELDAKPKARARAVA